MARAKIKYIADTHQYFLGKKELPSVSSLVAFALNEDLSHIPEEVLKRASEYGTAVHDAIQDYEINNNENPFFETELNKYKELKKKYLLNVSKMEQIVTDGKNFAGRYDILDEEGTLWDVKTSSTTYPEKWSWQLSLYQYALKTPNKNGYVIYIPKKGKHKVLLLELHPFSEVEELINLYKESLTNE